MSGETQSPPKRGKGRRYQLLDAIAKGHFSFEVDRYPISDANRGSWPGSPRFRQTVKIMDVTEYPPMLIQEFEAHELLRRLLVPDAGDEPLIANDYLQHRAVTKEMTPLEKIHAARLIEDAKKEAAGIATEEQERRIRAEAERRAEEIAQEKLADMLKSERGAKKDGPDKHVQKAPPKGESPSPDGGGDD